MKRVFVMFFIFLVPYCRMISAEQQHEHHEMKPEIEETKEGLTLQQVEEMALQNNPTIAQAEAAIQVAEGRKRQAGLYPNPTVGFLAEELSQRDPEGRSASHMFFFAEQTLLLGGKRGKARDVFEQQIIQTRAGVDLQKQRVLNVVRMLYYQLLALQQEIQVREKLQALAEEAAGITKELYNVGQADRPDDLEAEIEAETSELAVLAAKADHERFWNALVAVMGKPDMSVGRVAGSLDFGDLQISKDGLLNILLNESPQVKSARAQLQRAEAAVRLSKAQRIPDITLGGGIGYNNETLPLTNDPVGLEGFFEVGIPLPLFNRNQGNIAAAQAETERAKRELERVKLDLRARFTAIHAEFLKSKTRAEKYKQNVLPRASEAYQLYLASFRQMGAAYPQVLIAQRNQYQLEIEYLAAVRDLWTNAMQLQGFLLAEGALDAPTFSPFETEVTSPMESPALPRVR